MQSSHRHQTSDRKGASQVIKDINNAHYTKPSNDNDNPLTYPTSSLPFSISTFKCPPDEYRGAPFWAWVTKQEKTKTVEQIRVMKDMGMGGFHMHTRVGLDIPYMGEEYMQIVEGCVERAQREGMYACLYDEDRWPSGFAGGKVLEGHPELQGLHVLFTPWPYGAELPYAKSTLPIANAQPVRSELGALIAKYAIRLSSGRLVTSRVLQAGGMLQADEKIWYAYVEPNPPCEYMGDKPYTDLLNSDMTKRFIETTHEVYKQHVGEHFGRTVPSIFTDEPQYSPMKTLSEAEGEGEAFLPWTLAIGEEYKRRFGEDIIDSLPEIVWGRKQEMGQKYAFDQGATRARFLDLVCDLFTENYVGVLARWCNDNNLLCTGHMNAEPTLISQTAQNGEVMRTYRHMTLPGIDMLCDNFEFNTAKQAASVARQYGRSGVMSEEYGVTGWEFTFEGHKGQGDWQAALGVTLRVHHLFWSTMRGEAKRDYPACIGYQSPWADQYNIIEDHFARVNTALTRGLPVTKVAVIHPIESFWLCFGPRDKCGDEMEWRDEAFDKLTKWLLLGHIDFDFISESLFPELTPLSSITDGAELHVGTCSYQVVIVPNLKTIRSSTLQRLRLFVKHGGEVIIAGSSPSLVDTAKADDASLVEIEGARKLPWSKGILLKSLERHRDLDMTVNTDTIYRNKGSRADSLLYQMRKEGDEKFLFICNTDRKQPCPVKIQVRGKHTVEVLDTESGKTWELRSTTQDGKTSFNYWFDGCESVLLHLKPRREPCRHARDQLVLRRDFKQFSDVSLDSVTLAEPNILLLDMATYTFNDSPWSPPTEVLRIDQVLRAQLGFFKKGAKFRQPHTIPMTARQHAGVLRLRFEFTSDIEVSGASLAIEDPDQVDVCLDGLHVPSCVEGWWVDQDIKRVPLPTISSGQHSIELEYKYGPLTNLERIFILGVFGVSVRGRTARIVPLDLDRMEWGDITKQNLPFYTGNLTYHCSFTAPGSEHHIADENRPDLAVRVAHFSSPVISVSINDKKLGLLVNEPRALVLPLDAGSRPPNGDRHRISFTCFGNRHNAFGPIHLPPNKTNWIGADAWRTDFDWWSEEYVLGQVGIMNAPRVEVRGTEIPGTVRRGLNLHV